MAAMSPNVQPINANDNTHAPPHIESDFKQQRIPACRPFLTPCFGSIIFGVFCVFSIIFCVLYYTSDDGIDQIIIPYDQICNTSLTCTVNFDVHNKLRAPVYVYYQLSNVFQSNFMYASSRDWGQLNGEPFEGAHRLDKCQPVIGTVQKPEIHQIYVPCGAYARSVFNDNFVFSPGFPNIRSDGISSKNYRKLFKPRHQSYASAINWLDADFPGGQTNERFINWMKEASFPKFKKLWGRITDEDIQPGHYSIEIDNRFSVSQFKGTKSIILSEISWAGGKSKFLYYLYMKLAALSFLVSVVLFIMQYYHLFPLYKALAQEGASLELSLLL